ncbi:Tad domain-containing protein [Pseudoalteromonas sp. 2CM28B]|uniref:Tad domain-containing protein n=1 Tax=Pseudoalteromonas sp. 2CM28B TaxID=2929851 RepID=UPI0020C0BC95|nr:Tad domain-containing protein [Pseudoalteromonas sp. 2CM28B]MCK8136606.1 Tad domain-containing protein [Pseudoalteromonas sp. 2CM28B]
MHKERGQSLVLGSVFLATIVVSLLYLFNVSQQNLNKTKLQNSADATVISGANLLARDLNFKAYTNRAMVANHVAVAQYVGLSSWGNFAEKTGENIADVTSWIPLVGQITSAVEGVLTAINQVLQPAMKGAVFATDIVNSGLSLSQDLMNAATMVALVETSKNVLEANDSDAYVDIASAVGVGEFLLYDWVDFQGSYDRQDDTGRYQEHFDLITNSVDPFTENRSFSWGFPFSQTIFPDKVNTRQAGGTELFKNGDEAEVWSAMDTLGFHVYHYSCRLTSGCKWRGGEVPVGWGASHAGSDKDTTNYRSDSYYGRSRDINGRASRYAHENEEDINSYYSGLQSFYDISQVEQTNTAPMLTLAISKDKSDITTSSTLNIGTENPDSTRLIDIDIEESVALPRDKLTVLSKAKIYYYRDQSLWGRSDSKWEYGNLYNPYWQVTLNETDNSERVLLTALALVL